MVKNNTCSRPCLVYGGFIAALKVMGLKIVVVNEAILL